MEGPHSNKATPKCVFDENDLPGDDIEILGYNTPIRTNEDFGRRPASLHLRSRVDDLGSRSNRSGSNRRRNSAGERKSRRPRCLVAISNTIKWIRKEIRKKEILKTYFSLLFTFPKSIFCLVIVSLLTLGVVGTMRREYFRDMHKLYAMKDSDEIAAYDRNLNLWRDSTGDLMMIARPVQEGKDVWDLDSLHFGGWLDAIIRHVAIKAHDLRDLAAIENGDSRNVLARKLAQGYLNTVPPYDPGKALCDCPSCTGEVCLHPTLGAVPLNDRIRKSDRVTMVFRTNTDMRVSFADYCVKNTIHAAGAFLTSMDTSYACQGLTPFTLVPEMRDVVVPGKRGIFRHVDHSMNFSRFADNDLVLGSRLNTEFDAITKASALGFFYKLKSPETEKDKYLLDGLQTVLEAVAVISPYHLVDSSDVQVDWHVSARTSRSLQDALDASTTFDTEMQIRLCAAVFAVSLVLLWGVGLERNIKSIFRNSVSKTIDTNKTDLEPDTVMYLLGFGGLSMLCIVASGFGASGMLYLCGMPHVPASESIPFMVLGIGIDDFFVIWNAYMQTYQSIKIVTPQNRVLKAYRATANSITLSTFTTVISFLIGSINPFWHIQIFSSNVAVCILSLYLACWVLIPILILNHAHNHQSDAVDIAESELKISKLISASMDLSKAAKLRKLDFADRTILSRSQLYWNGPRLNGYGEDVTPVHDATTSFHDQTTRSESSVSTINSKLPLPSLWTHRYALFLLHPTVKICIVTAVLITTIISSSLITWKLRFGLDLKDATPFSSSLRKYLVVQADHFPNYGDEFDITAILPSKLLEQPKVTFDLLNQWTEALCNPDANIESFNLTVGTCHNPVLEAAVSVTDSSSLRGEALRDELLQTFERISVHALNPLNPMIYTKGMPMLNLYTDSFDQEEAKKVFYYRMKLVVPVMADTTNSWEWYQTLRGHADTLQNTLTSMMEDVPGYQPDYDIAPEILISSQLLPMWSADAFIHIITITSLLTALICVTVCSYLLLGRSPMLTGLILYTMILVDVHLMGLMILMGGTLNILTMITLLMAQGFSVDYLAHMCHAFSHSRLRNCSLRSQSAIVSVGKSIFQATMTTCVALFCLILSDKYTLRVFCRMVVSTIGCAFVFSMVYLPIMLSFVNPKYLPVERKRRREKSRELDLSHDLNYTERFLEPVNNPKRVAMHRDPDKFLPCDTMLYRTVTPVLKSESAIIAD